MCMCFCIAIIQLSSSVFDSYLVCTSFHWVVHCPYFICSHPICYCCSMSCLYGLKFMLGCLVIRDWTVVFFSNDVFSSMQSMGSILCFLYTCNKCGTTLGHRSMLCVHTIKCWKVSTSVWQHGH